MLHVHGYLRVINTDRGSSCYFSIEYNYALKTYFAGGTVSVCTPVVLQFLKFFRNLV